MGSCLCSVFFHVTSAIQVILAIVIVILVAAKLDNTSITIEGTDLVYKSDCALGNSVDSSSLCNYVYVVVAISLAVSLVISLLQCLTCNMCGLGKVLDVLFAGVGTVWWVIASGVVQKNVNDAPEIDQKIDDYRTATVAMMWTEVALFGLMVITGIFRMCG